MKKLMALGGVILGLSAASAHVTVGEPWARAGTGPNGAMFMNLHCDGNADQLVKAAVSQDVCDHMELHTHLHENGVMKMREVSSIDVTPDHDTKLEPGGLHIMFMGIKKPLEEGQVIPVSLTYASGETQTIDVPVKASAKPCHCNKNK